MRVGVIPGLIDPEDAAYVTTAPWDQLLPQTFNQGAAIASAVVKAKPGALYGWNLTNGNAAARWIQFFDSTTLPADTAVPLFSVALAIGGSSNITLVTPRVFLKGIVVCNSSTATTKTIGTADSLVDLLYI
jgi:hypothetical protein